MPLFLACLIALCLSCAYRPVGDINTATQQVQNRLFDPKEFVDIRLISGSCLVKAGPVDAIHVRVAHRYGPAEKFAAQFVEEEGLLKLAEEFYTLAPGQTEWTVEVPPTTSLRVHTASGKVILNALAGEVEVETVSGDIDVRRAGGKLALQTTSGDVQLTEGDGALKAQTGSGSIRLKDTRGPIVLQTASGDIEGKNIGGWISCQAASGSIALSVLEPSGPAFFTTASGDLRVDLSEPPQHDLTLQTASGDATLRFNGASIEGHYVFYAEADRGEIAAPFAFDRSEDIVLDGRPHRLRSFTRGDLPRPVTLIRTASGRAALEP